jgi:hypothetical protein
MLVLSIAVSVRLLCVEELAETPAFDFDTAEGDIEFHPDWRLNNQEGAILSTCSNLITINDTRDSRVALFYRRPVKEFLTSTYLAFSMGNVFSYHILSGRAHTILALRSVSKFFSIWTVERRWEYQGLPSGQICGSTSVRATQFGNVGPRIEYGAKSL